MTLAAAIDHFAHTRAAAGAEIVKGTLLRFERQDMRARQIENVNVVANAGAIRCVVIGAVNFNMRFFAERDLQHIRDEMRLAAMVFAKFCRRAGGIEIAQRDKAQSVDLIVPAQDFLEGEL